MTQLFFKLLGIPGDTVVRLRDAELQLSGGLPAGWMMLLGISLVALTIELYRRTASDLAPRRRYLLTALRCLLLLVLVAVLMRPVLRFTVEGSIRRAMLILVDDSASMKIIDERTGDDIARAAMAQGLIDPTGGLQQDLTGQAGRAAQLPRVELVQSMLANPRLNLLPRLAEAFDLRPFRFGETLAELLPADDAEVPTDHAAAAWLRQLRADDASTRLGDALREALMRSRGQPLAGMLLVTDGASNSGALPLAAAELARQQGVPLYVYGVGITSPRELVISSLFAPETAFYDDTVPVTVRVRSRGLKGQRTRLRLQLVPQNPAGAPAEQTIEEDVVLEDGEQVIHLSITPTRPDEGEGSRDYDLVATLPPAAGVDVPADNLRQAQPLRVIDGRIKVLLVEQQPRWEYRYLQAHLMRDRRVELKTVLLAADAGIAADPDGPYLPGIPLSREALLAYDLIILGDLDAQALAASQIAAIEAFVSEFGGGLLVIAGRQNELAAVRGTALEKLLPVEINGPRNDRRDAAEGSRPIRIELTPAGARSTMLQLADTPARSATVWAELPPIYWTARVGRAKPAAEVLLAESAGSLRQAPMPILVLHQFGRGQVLFSGTDNTWRWRRGDGEKHYTALWSQIVQRLALPKLLGESKRTQLSTDRHAYAAGERVTIFARLYGADYLPIQQAQVEGTYTSADGAQGSIVLGQEQPGFYRGEFVAPRPGAYRFSVETDPATQLTFTVGNPRLETGELAMNQPLLEQMAAMTDGRFYREETLHELPEQMKQTTESIRSTVDVDLWASPMVFIAFMLLLTTEWILRKLWQLK